MEKLVPILECLTVKHGRFLGLEPNLILAIAEIGKTLPSNGHSFNVLSETIGEAPLAIFLLDRLKEDIYNSGKYNKDEKSTKLLEMSGYGDMQNTAAKLIESFNQLPYKYIATFPLSDEISSLLSLLKANEIKFKDMNVLVGAEDINKNFPRTTTNESIENRVSGLASLMIPTSNKWNESKYFFQVTTTGYASPHTTTPTVEHIFSKVKAFWGLGLALNLFSVAPQHHSTFKNDHIYLHKQENSGWHIHSKISFSENPLSSYSRLQPYSIDDESFNTHRQKAKLEVISQIISNEEKSRRILSAAEWLYNGYMNLDTLLAFVQSMIVIEILLGDKATSEKVGLCELLANRCAYSIASTESERAKIIKDFKEIYDIRSQIVHNGYQRLSSKESHMLHKLQWMCRRILSQEVHLLKNDLNKSNAV